MTQRTNFSPIKLILGFFLILILLNFYNCSQTKRYKKKLNNILYLSTENDTLCYNSVANLKEGEILFADSYIDILYAHQSPFGDGKDFKTLCKEYIHNRYQDYYGANRRTGKCKRIHEGVDLFVPENTPLYPMGKIGIVTQVSHNPNFLMKVACLRSSTPTDSVLVEYGKIVRVLYPEGYETIYAHMNEVDVEVNQIVYADTKLGVTGVTGNLKRSGKPSHLHFELRDKDNKSFDPKHRLNYDQNDYKVFIEMLDLKNKNSE